MAKLKKAILSANLKLVIFLVLITVALPFHSGSALAQTSADTAESSPEIVDRLDKIEKNQAELLENQQKILEELKNLRVWVRRN